MLLGDRHESLQSCSLPDDEWITNYKKGFIDNISQMRKIFKKGGSITHLYSELKQYHEKIQDFYKNYLDNVQFNKNGMFIFDYILLLSKGNTCIDFYDEQGLSTQLQNIIIESDRGIDKRIYYAKILSNFLMFLW